MIILLVLVIVVQSSIPLVSAQDVFVSGDEKWGIPSTLQVISFILIIIGCILFGYYLQKKAKKSLLK